MVSLLNKELFSAHSFQMVRLGSILDIHFGTDIHINRKRVNLQILIPNIYTSSTPFKLLMISTNKAHFTINDFENMALDTGL